MGAAPRRQPRAEEWPLTRPRAALVEIEVTALVHD